MKLVAVARGELVVSDELSRSGSAKQFEERLRSSIEEIGLAEPIKVAPLPDGGYLVVDGLMRLRAIEAIREGNPNAFEKIPAYVTDYERRFEIRYQTDIYQDLLPSQLAGLVEHLHRTEHVKKADIARYIGVSPATLRNYTGVWRLLQRGGFFARVVELMDVGVIPSSNPYAWLRLTDDGLEHVLLESFCDDAPIAAWFEQRIAAARQGSGFRYTTYFVESATDDLDPGFYREDEDLRSVKRDLGLRRGINQQLFEEPGQPTVSSTPKPTSTPKAKHNVSTTVKHLTRVTKQSREPVLQSAARSLKEYLQ